MSAILTSVEQVMKLPVVPEKNVIPKMTHPFGQYWRQPDVAKFLIDDESAVMSQAAFDTLAEYSRSVPTGVYPGKCWKRLDSGVWWLVWFGYSSKGHDYCSKNYRKILIA